MADVTELAEPLEGDSRLSPEGRVVVPVAIRQALGLRPGDRVRFVLQGGQVHLLTARSLVFDLWAANTGGDGGDATALMRTLREEDQQASSDKLERIAAARAADTRTEDEITDDLMRQMGDLLGGQPS